MSSFSIRPLGKVVEKEGRREAKNRDERVDQSWSHMRPPMFSESDLQSSERLEKRKGNEVTRDPRRWKRLMTSVENLLLHPTTEIILTQMSTFAIVALVFLHALEISSHDIFAFTCEERGKGRKDRSFRERRKTKL